MRQHALSTNLNRLTTTAEQLSAKHVEHASAIVEAQNMTNDILDTLETVAGIAIMIEEADKSRWGGMGLGRWVPYIVSPVATLLLGSYGLAPSVLRNLGLVVLGELVGFSVSHLDHFAMPWEFEAFNNVASNTTMTTA